MPDTWAEYGILGLVMFVVLKNLFEIIRDLVKAKAPDSGKEIKISCSSSDCPLNKVLEEILSKTNIINEKVSDLDEMHKKFDNDGSPKWFVKDSLTNNVQKTADGTMSIQRDLQEYMRNQGSTMKTLSGHLEALNTLLRKITGG